MSTRLDGSHHLSSAGILHSLESIHEADLLTRLLEILFIQSLSSSATSTGLLSSDMNETSTSCSAGIPGLSGRHSHSSLLAHSGLFFISSLSEIRASSCGGFLLALTHNGLLSTSLGYSLFLFCQFIHSSMELLFIFLSCLRRHLGDVNFHRFLSFHFFLSSYESRS